MRLLWCDYYYYHIVTARSSTIRITKTPLLFLSITHHGRYVIAPNVSLPVKFPTILMIYIMGNPNEHAFVSLLDCFR